jgi:hypothetical protein
MTRDYESGDDGKRQGQQGADAGPSMADRQRQVYMMRRRRQQQKSSAANPEMKGQAAAFRETMRRKIESVKGLVDLSTKLFLSVMLSEQMSDEDGSGAGPIVQFIVEMAFSEITGGLSKAIFALAKDVAKESAEAAWEMGLASVSRSWKETAAAERGLKQAFAVEKSGAKASMHDNGDGGTKAELALIHMICGAMVSAAEKFVDKALPALDSIPDEQAAADYQLLGATKKAPGVHEAAMGDSAEQGNVEKGIEDQFLEAAGAPVTGGAEAEKIAVNMLRYYKAQRVTVFHGLKVADKVQETLADPAPEEIKKAEKNLKEERSIKAEGRQRDRASGVGKAMGEDQ